METCAYCGNPRNGKDGCCGEYHFDISDLDDAEEKNIPDDGVQEEWLHPEE